MRSCRSGGECGLNYEKMMEQQNAVRLERILDSIAAGTPLTNYPDFKRGDIWWVTNERSVGTEIHKRRPYVIVSDDALNKTSSKLNVVPLTTSMRQADRAGNVVVRSSGKTSVALCSQIKSVSVSRMLNRIGTCTKEEMHNIDKALVNVLHLQRAREETASDTQDDLRGTPYMECEYVTKFGDCALYGHPCGSVTCTVKPEERQPFSKAI